MSDDLDRLHAELDELPRNLRRSLRPVLPTSRQVPRGWRDVARCLLGRHRVILSGRDAGLFVERCSCGAMRVDRHGWFDAHPFTLRDADGYSRRQRRIQRQINDAAGRIVADCFPSD